MQQIDFNRTVNYELVKYKMSPLDLLIFRGDSFISDFISETQERQLGSGDISHVGMVVTARILDFYLDKNRKKVYLDPTKVYILESISKGVVIRPLKKVIEGYHKAGGEVGWAKLRKPELVTSFDFTKVFRKYHGLEYDLDVLDLSGGLYPWMRCLRNTRNKFLNFIYNKFLPNKKNPTNRQFCSELIANVLRDLNIISQEIEPQNVMPMDLLGYDQDNIKEAIYEDPVFFEKKN